MEPSEFREKLEEKISKRRISVLLGSITVLGISAFLWPKYVVAASLVVLTVLISLATKLLEINDFGIELGTFTAVTMGAVFGPEAGAVIAVAAVGMELLTGTPGPHMLWVIPGYAAAGFIAGTLGTTGIAMNGIKMALGLQSFFLLSTLIITPDYIGRYLPYAVSNVIFNALLFQTFAVPLVQLIA